MAKLLCILTQLESTGQNVTVRPAAMPQVVQFPTLQQTVPVQVPLTTANGQTVYHTVHFPLQALAATSLGPNISQVQMIPQVCCDSSVGSKNTDILKVYYTYILYRPVSLPVPEHNSTKGSVPTKLMMIAKKYL